MCCVIFSPDNSVQASYVFMYTLLAIIMIIIFIQGEDNILKLGVIKTQQLNNSDLKILF